MNDDTYALLAWLRGKELEAHNKIHIEDSDDVYNYYSGLKDAFREVINHIENNPKELHRCLIPAGWDTIDP